MNGIVARRQSVAQSRLEMAALDTIRDGGICFFAGICHIAPCSGLGRLLLRLGRLAAAAAALARRGFRRAGRRGRDFVRLGTRPEERPTARRELGLVADHAGGDAIDVRNLRTTQAERVAAAGLLLFGRIGRRRCRPDRNREYRCQHQAELDILRPANRHGIPRGADLRGVWENAERFASQGGAPATAEASQVEIRCRCLEGSYSRVGTRSTPD